MSNVHFIFSNYYLTKLNIDFKPFFIMSKKGSSTRDLLIEKATPLFAKKGYSNTTIKDICDATGMNVSLVSYYFGGKEGLFYACIENFAKFGLNTAERILIEPGSKEEFKVRLGMFLDEMINIHLEHSDLLTLVYMEMESQNLKSSDIFKKTFARAFELCVAFFDAGRKIGVMDRSLDPRLSAAIFFGAVKSFFTGSKLRRQFLLDELNDPSQKKKIKEHYIKIFCEGFYNETKNS